jgi:hypothetical protein
MTQQDTTTASAPDPAPLPAPPSSPAAAPATGQDRFLLAIVAGTLLLVLVSIAVVFAFGRGRPTLPADPSSPAGVTQAYIEAVRAGDADKARSYLTRQALDEFNRQTRISPLRPTADEHLRIVVETTSVTDTSAEVKVTVSRFYTRSDPFSSGTSHQDVIARLVREDGVWKLSQPPQPYEIA